MLLSGFCVTLSIRSLTNYHSVYLSILKLLLVPFLRDQSAVTRYTEWAKVKVQSHCLLDVFKTLQSTLRFWEKSKSFELSFN